jgi:hypothetical protein
VLRGGSWNNNANNVRSANRNNNNPGNDNNNIGFRCSAPAGSFLKSQVRTIHGWALPLRVKVPGLFLVEQPIHWLAQPKMNPPCPFW